MKYADYFDIDPAYYPIIDPDSIKNADVKWQNTYPHKTFINVLEGMEKMLARDTVSDRHSLWIEGSYGTGKSRVIWTLENILTCSDDELRDYFDKFEVLRKKGDLLTKLLAHKSQKIITAYRYGSGEISSIRQFIIAVFDSISSALDKAGIDYRKNRTLRGKIAEWIEKDETSRSIFASLISKPEYRGMGSFSGKNVDDIVAQLNNISIPADYLIDDILALADKEGIRAFDLDMEALREWITEVIKDNNLKAIVLFWDEFSSFFKNNKTSLDTFQRIAELSESTCFHLVIATHTSNNYLIGSAEDNSFKAVWDRFNHYKIEMPDNVAFELIHDAIKIKPAAKDEYLEISSELNAAMAEPRKAVCEKANISEKILEGIFPIHPMSALLLKYISTSFASNQRSMFNFIKNDDSDELHAFQWFIKTYGPDDDQVLTIDYLWNFFYEKGSDENTSLIGRSNLDRSIATILDTYPANEKTLREEEKRVLKAILMLQAISKKLNNAVELFRPTDKNIELAFKGDDQLENFKAVNIAKNILVKQKILYIDSNGKIDEYAAAAVAGDQVQIDAIKERLKKDTKTLSLIAAGEFDSVFAFPESIKIRYQFYNVTVDNFYPTINRIANEKETNGFFAVICYARNDDELIKMRSLIAEARQKKMEKDIVFIDASANIMGIDLFDSYLDVAAQEEYWRPKDSKLADAKQKNKNEILVEWKNSFSTGSSFVVYHSNYKENCNSISGVREKLSSIVLEKYPLSFDNAKVSENFFITDKYTQGAKLGVAQNFGGIFQEKFIRSILGKVLNVEKYWEVYPTEAISKLKLKIDELIDARFQKDARISIGEIFDKLVELGFYPCNLYAYLTGFLLKEYSSDFYRYGIGVSGDDGGRMSPDKLAEFIGEYIKHRNSTIRNYKEKYIEIMTKEQKTFVDFAHYVFNTSDNLSVEQTVSRVRTRLKDDIGYPLWCFEYIDNQNLGEFLEKLALIANPKDGSNVPTVASQIGKLLINIPSAKENLKKLISSENGTRAMHEFLETFENGELLKLADEIGIPNVMDDVKRQIGSGEASWLWDKDTGIEELKNLLVDYKIIAESNKINKRTNSFFYCIQEWKSFSNFIKLPYSLCKELIPELGTFFECLKNITKESDLPNDKHESFLSELENKSALISGLKDRVRNGLKSHYSIYLKDFSDSDIEKLVTKLPHTSFLSDESVFTQELKKRVDEIKSEQEKFKLIELWKNVSGTNSPGEWSNKYRTPIIALVPEEDRDSAKKVFDTINSNNADMNEYTSALNYLNRNPSFLKDLNDTEKIETAFKSCLIRGYASVLNNNDEVRDHLENELSVPCYDWYDSRLVSDEIAQMARLKYFDGGNAHLINQIDKMSAEEAKALLKKLVNDSVDVGISIIKLGGQLS